MRFACWAGRDVAEVALGEMEDGEGRRPGVGVGEAKTLSARAWRLISEMRVQVPVWCGHATVRAKKQGMTRHAQAEQ
jgi:hypothetical protein